MALFHGRYYATRVAYRIVPTAEAHIAGFHAVLDSVAREKRYLLFLEAPSLENCTTFVQENIRKCHVALVALLDERVVGWCDILPIPRHSTRHVGVVGLGVLEGFRGRGIGPALLQAALDKARAAGMTRIELDVREDNLPAIALYERFGFEREGLKRNAVRVDGKYGNLIGMALFFQ